MVDSWPCYITKYKSGVRYGVEWPRRWMTTISKHVHESTLYLIIFDDFGVVRKLRPRALQRHQNRRKWWGIRSIRAHVLIWFSFNGVNEHLKYSVIVRMSRYTCNSRTCRPWRRGTSGIPRSPWRRWPPWNNSWSRPRIHSRESVDRISGEKLLIATKQGRIYVTDVT